MYPVESLFLSCPYQQATLDYYPDLYISVLHFHNLQMLKF